MHALLHKNKSQEKLIRQVSQVAQYLWEKGWSERNAGNISIRLDPETSGKISNLENYEKVRLDHSFPALAGQTFFITATGKRMRDLVNKPSQNALLIHLDEHGQSYAAVYLKKNLKEKLRPTSELNTHLSIHQMIVERGSAEKVILHTHATELIALTQHPSIKSQEKINQILWGMHPETIIFIPKGIAYVPYELPGSIEIARATVENLKNNDIVLWEKHGVFAIGANISDTFDNIDILCRSAKIWFMCRSAGFEPEGLNNLQLNDLKELVKKFNVK